MTTTSLRKWGNSQGLYIPKDMLRELGIALDSRVTLEVVDGAIVIRKADVPSSRKMSAFAALQKIRNKVLMDRDSSAATDSDYRRSYMDYLDERYGQQAGQEDE